MDVLKKPMMTESAANLHESGVYTFVVDKKADKPAIKKAVEEMYNVQVAKVRTAIIPGKPKQRYTKAGMVNGQTAAYKKAFVQLKEGEFIDLYEGI